MTAVSRFRASVAPGRLGLENPSAGALLSTVVALVLAFVSALWFTSCAPSVATDETTRSLLPSATLPSNTEVVDVPATFFDVPADLTRDDSAEETLGLSAGFNLVTPHPYAHARLHRVRIVVRLPSGDRMRLDAASNAQPAIEFPVGTWLARVEEIETKAGGFTVADVRGVRFDRDRETFFVLRPTAPGVHVRLVGLGWPRDDIATERSAHERLATLMRETNYGFVRPPRDLDKASSHFVSIGRCSACHERNKPDFLQRQDRGERTGFFPRRRTDANGYYSLASLFRLEQPRENYGALHDVDGAHFSSRPTSKEHAAAAPLIKFDLDAAAAAQSDHAVAVCATRRTLHEQLTPNQQPMFAELLPRCGAVD